MSAATEDRARFAGALEDHALDDDELLGCCGCMPADDSPSAAPSPAMPGDPAFGSAPTPLPPPPPDGRRSSSPPTLALDALERRLYLRIGVLEAHVDALAGALARRDAADRERRMLGERVATQAEERALAALVELLSFTWREWRESLRRAPRGV